MDATGGRRLSLEPVYDLEARYGEGASKAIVGQSFER
jgi:hypothetical protein